MSNQLPFEIIFDDAVRVPCHAQGTAGSDAPPSEEEDDLDSLLLVHNQRFLQLLDDGRQRVRITGGVPLAEFRRRLEDDAVE